MSKGQGKLIGIKFTEKLIGDISGLTPNPVGGYGYKRILDALITVSGTVNYTAKELIDGDLNTLWWAGPSNYIQAQFSTAVCKTGFRWYIGHGSYYPTAFSIAGSNDGSNFTTLGTFSGTGTVGWQAFTFENTMSYLYYRITTTAVMNGYSFIYELQFLDPVGNEKAFTVSGNEYNYVPEGTLSAKTYTVLGVSAHPTETNSILLSIADFSKFENVYGDLTISYDGSGNLMGLGGPVLAFSVTFTPAELIPKPDQHAIGHIEITAITSTGNLVRVYYAESKEEEHIEITGVTAMGTLTHVNDL